MVKHIPRQPFDDEEFSKLQELKNNSRLNWANFILEAAKSYEREHNVRE